MTANALLSYLGVALLFAAAVFFVIGICRFRKRRNRESVSAAEAPRNDKDLRATQGADLLCGTILIAAALIAEVVSRARGGPASGQPSGNTAGGVLAIALATISCVTACLVVRHPTLLHLRRKLDARVGFPMD
jgi:hypothetical protein